MLRVPQVVSPTLVADTVPFQVVPKKAGDAQATIGASATTAAPGAGTRLEVHNWAGAPATRAT